VVIMEKLMKMLNFKNGLIPAVIQDAESRRVLTLCYMDEEALRKTLQTGKIYVFRRSKGRVMMKGESSGHIQEVVEMRVDCEGNSLLFLVKQHKAACHAGYFSCYYRKYEIEEDKLSVDEEKIFDPEEVYKSG